MIISVQSLASSFLRDLPYAIFPWRQEYDRGQALEDAMVALRQAPPKLGYTFSQLLEGERQGLIPSLGSFHYGLGRA